MKLTITVPIPPRDISPNGRPHWRTKARKVKIARRQGHDAALDTLDQLKMKPPKWTVASITPMVYIKDRRSRWDRDNIIGACKAYCDGIADAGVVKNDSGFRWNDPVFSVDKSTTRIDLVIERVEG